MTLKGPFAAFLSYNIIDCYRGGDEDTTFEAKDFEKVRGQGQGL